MTDTDRRTEPAMDAEDWDYFLSGGIRKHTLQDAVECAERGRRDLTPHSLAALALHGERYGFTHEELDELLATDPDMLEFEDRLAGILAKIRRLLPPR